VSVTVLLQTVCTLSDRGNLQLIKRWRREASHYLAPPAHINDVRRACDVLTPSGAQVNASSISPVGWGLYHICRRLDEEFFVREHRSYAAGIV